MALQALPSINYIYADKAGNIGYVYNGLFPDRREGVDWSGVLPGDRSDLVWKGYRSFDKVPQLWNPPSGLVFNANNTPYQSTALGDGMDPEAYPASMGVQTNMTNRAWRLTETYAADPAITVDEFRAYKYDLAYSRKSELAGVLSEVARLDAGGDADLAAAKSLLAGWNLRTDRDNRAAPLGVTTALAVINGRSGDGPKVSVREALLASIKTLKAGFGRIDPTWGEVNRIRRGDVDLPIDGGPDVLRAVYGKPEKDGRLTGVAGDTYIMVVTWDRAGNLASESIHQFGSGAERPSSKHYADQVPLFAAMKTRPVLFTEAQLAGNIAEDYRPGARKKAP
jgi:penicillin amidase/acyl-homoserine-lactone acylase